MSTYLGQCSQIPILWPKERLLSMSDFFMYFDSPRAEFLLVCLLISLVTFAVVLVSKPSEAQKWMLVAATGVVLYFSMNLAPADPEMIARKMTYIATCWLGLGAIFSLMAICEASAPKPLQYAAVVFLILLSTAIVTINYHDGWDCTRLVESSEEPGVYIEESANGWMYYLYNIGLLAVLFGFAVYLAVRISRKKGSKRNALTVLALFIGIPAVAWIGCRLFGFTTARSNFVLIAGLDTAILVLQLRYDILTTLPVAKEQVVEASDEGIIILDGKKRFLYANATARHIFPELCEANEDLVTQFIREKLLSCDQNERFMTDGQFYSLYGEDIREQEKTIGKTLWLKNVTAEINYSNMLLKRSETDLMTGLMNRGGGEKKITGLLAEHAPGMFCLLDADHFKSFNDTFGHAVGDKVICAIADALRATLGPTESVVMRLGGDEFAFYVKDIANENQGLALIRGLFSRIAEVKIEGTDGRHIYVSLGAVLYDGIGDCSFDELYHAADKGTYASKSEEGYQATFKTL